VQFDLVQDLPSDSRTSAEVFAAEQVDASTHRVTLSCPADVRIGSGRNDLVNVGVSSTVSR
jgi:hypothetical protein